MTTSHIKSALEETAGIEREVSEMKKDAERLGKEMSNHSEREQSEQLANLKGHMKDLGQIRDLEVITQPFWRGTKY
jgi:predicted RNase H-like nuclease (RuvC/YqgF family)